MAMMRSYMYHVTGKEFDTSKLERLGLSEIQTKDISVSFIRFSKI